MIGDGLSILDSPHLDMAGLQVAGRIDITAWQAGAERYISFLKGRGDVAGWFKRCLGRLPASPESAVPRTAADKING